MYSIAKHYIGEEQYKILQPTNVFQVQHTELPCSIEASVEFKRVLFSTGFVCRNKALDSNIFEYIMLYSLFQVQMIVSIHTEW